MALEERRKDGEEEKKYDAVGWGLPLSGLGVSVNILDIEGCGYSNSYNLLLTRY